MKGGRRSGIPGSCARSENDLRANNSAARFAPTFTPVLLRKDLDLGLRAGDELGVPMPVTSAALLSLLTLSLTAPATSTISASLTGLPLSSDSSWASCSEFSSILSASALISAVRLTGESVAQPDSTKAARAALTARSTSSTPPWATVASVIMNLDEAVTKE